MNGVSTFFVFSSAYAVVILWICGSLIWGKDRPADTFMGKLQGFFHATGLWFWKLIFFMSTAAFVLMLMSII